MNYIVFPGNVGTNESLYHVAMRLGVPEKTNTSLLQQSIIDTSIQSIRNSNKTYQILSHAKSSHAIAAFNIYNLEGAKAVVDAAQELNSPVIIQVRMSYY